MRKNALFCAFLYFMKGEIGGACSMHGKDEKTSQTLVGKPERKDHLEDLGIDVQLVLKWTLEK